ncbi:MAG: hypothetical protein QOF73_406, partial [Thermomicrobiales bacterium]|nr:hypothetical protein [Thermomicrobiales bacterium]
MMAGRGFRSDQLDAVYELLGRIAEVFVATVGRTAEVVVHDLRNLDASVVAIAGNLTGREVGAPIPDAEFLPENLAQVDADQQGYATRTPTGRTLSSSTVWIRDVSGKIVGAVCINVDHNDIREALGLLVGVIDDLPPTALVPTPVVNDSVLTTF